MNLNYFIKTKPLMNNNKGKISRAQRYKIKYKYPLFLSENNFGICEN